MRLAESHAAAVRHRVIRNVRMMGRRKRCRSSTRVMAAKQRASAHTVPRMNANVVAGRFLVAKPIPH